MLFGTIPNAVKKLRLMTYTAYKNGWIPIDPFRGFRVIPQYRDRRFLSERELQAVINANLPNCKTRIVRDIFVFCAFTGLSYADVNKLTMADIYTDDNDESWIIDLIAQYSRLNLSGGIIFPVKDRDSMNMSLRHVARHAGLSFNPTMHTARHTFATTVTLTQGVPLETVSKMLGHKHITTTQIYAKITNDKIGRDMDALAERIGDKFKMAR